MIRTITATKPRATTAAAKPNTTSNGTAASSPRDRQRCLSCTDSQRSSHNAHGRQVSPFTFDGCLRPRSRLTRGPTRLDCSLTSRLTALRGRHCTPRGGRIRLYADKSVHGMLRGVLEVEVRRLRVPARVVAPAGLAMSRDRQPARPLDAQHVDARAPCSSSEHTSTPIPVADRNDHRKLGKQHDGEVTAVAASCTSHCPHCRDDGAPTHQR